MKKTLALFAALCLAPIVTSANQVEPSTDDAGGKHNCVELCGCIDEGSLEEFLRTADVVSIEDVGTGITKPQRVTLRKDGQECRAIDSRRKLLVTELDARGVLSEVG